MADPRPQHEQSPSLRLATDTESAGSWWHRFDYLVRLIKSESLTTLTPAAHSVFMVLYIHANKRMVAFPGAKTIARLAGMSESTVVRARKQLVDRGIIEQVNEGGGRTSTAYRLLDREWQAQTDGGDTSGGPPKLSDHPTDFDRAGHSKSVGSPPKNDPLTVSIEPEPLTDDVVGDFPGEVLGEVVPDGAGLFDGDAVKRLLVGRDIADRDAERAVRQWGVKRCMDGITHTDFIDSKGEIRKSWRHAYFAWLKSDAAIDGRHAHAEQRKAKAVQAIANRDDKRAGEQAERDAMQRQREADDALLASTSPQAIEQATRQARAAMPEPVRRMNEGKTLSHPGLRAAVLAVLRKGAPQ